MVIHMTEDRAQAWVNHLITKVNMMSSYPAGREQMESGGDARQSLFIRPLLLPEHLQYGHLQSIGHSDSLTFAFECTAIIPNGHANLLWALLQSDTLTLWDHNLTRQQQLHHASLKINESERKSEGGEGGTLWQANGHTTKISFIERKSQELRK